MSKDKDAIVTNHTNRTFYAIQESGNKFDIVPVRPGQTVAGVDVLFAESDPRKISSSAPAIRIPSGVIGSPRVDIRMDSDGVVVNVRSGIAGMVAPLIHNERAASMSNFVPFAEIVQNEPFWGKVLQEHRSELGLRADALGMDASVVAQVNAIKNSSIGVGYDGAPTSTIDSPMLPNVMGSRDKSIGIT
ncbi:MAG: hypothetical protein EAZ74_00750 [Alphaproteobacteria bacterium]|nr:MAG: hypothetical protein EAZ74_00750 [Alphaproteobacteria bacterium]TAF77267.1 MAG: hypothetical protein EAZ52_01665 [Alphaproteobacteria bacterium]